MGRRHEHAAEPGDIEKTVDFLILGLVDIRIRAARPIFLGSIGNVPRYALICIDIITCRRQDNAEHQIAIALG